MDSPRVKSGPESSSHQQSENGGCGADSVRTQFRFFWQEFLLISIEPTLAATEALQLLAGREHPRECLSSHQAEAARLERSLVKPLLSSISPEAALQAVENDAVKFFSDFYTLNKIFMPEHVSPSHESPAVDWKQLSQFYDSLGQALDSNIAPERTLALTQQVFSSIQNLAETLQTNLAHNPESLVEPIQLRFLILLLGSSLFDRFPAASKLALSELHRLHSQISPRNREMLAKWYETLPVDTLRQLVSTTQEHITLSILDASAGGIHALRDSEAPRLRHALGVLKVLFEANKRRQNFIATSLSLEALNFERSLDREADDVQRPLNLADFYNDAINATDILIRFDFFQWKRGEALDFDLIGNSFVLDVATKAWYLLYHSILHQEMSGRGSLIQFFGVPILQPYLVLRVRRSEIVHDALRKLTATVAEGDLGKQLKVVFDEEEAVDEGGVTKEFFQLLIEQLFNPNYGMFTYNEKMRVFWFDRRSLESSLQFELIGVVLGLAIYNGVILDVHFPLAVYKKLLGVPVGIRDMEEFEPELANSLRQLLLMAEDDVRNSDLTFSIDVVSFGNVETIALSDEYGPDEPVTASNRVAYVAAYIDWVLNRSIQSQFQAFHRGFMKCCGEEIRKLALQPEELLLVICGSAEFDFKSLEKVTKYRDGYTGEEQTVRDFWEVVHALSEEDKKKLLFFVTGSDRVPVKGLSSIQFYIGRAGSDTEKIPTAHTCFNYLLLPDYRDKEKLKKYLTIALRHHTGFGLR